MDTSNTLPRVGFIGLGLMGYPMARNIARAGFPVTVYNRTRSKAEALAAEAAVTLADSPRAVAESSDIVVTIVSDVPDVDQVYLTPETGILAGGRSGMVCVDMGTVGPACAQRIAGILKERGIGFIDAPVSGGSWGAQQGTLSIMCGGAKTDYERVVPVLEAMGKKLVHAGEAVGSGQKVKLTNNIVVALTTEAACEGVIFAMKSGVSVEAALEAVGAGAAGSWTWTNLAPRMASGDYAPGFKIEHQIKDLKLALEVAKDAGFSLPGTELVLAQLEKVRDTVEDGGGKGTQALIEALK